MPQGLNLTPATNTINVRPANVVMQIVELDHCAITGFQHFHERQLGDSLDLFLGQLVKKTVHQLPPRPKLSLGLGSRLSFIPARAKNKGDLTISFVRLCILPKALKRGNT